VLNIGFICVLYACGLCDFRVCMVVIIVVIVLPGGS